jgi:propionyl-CoA carboxylase beta chain
MEELGGAMTHNQKSGVAHFTAEDDDQAMIMIRELMSFLPSNNMEDPPVKVCTDDLCREEPKLDEVIPPDPNKPYDMMDIIMPVIDNHHFLEVQPHYAKNIIVGFARIAGKPVGIVANQPAVLAGVLDINSSTKAARFVRFCDAFNIPLITFEDVPGFLPGTAQEFGGIIKHGAKLLYAFAEATVPKITIITRKAYGGAYDVMSSKHIGADYNFAYPTAEIAVMGPDGAVNIIYRNKINSDEERQKAVEEYRENFASPYKAAELGYIDEIIFPHNTRKKLVQALEMTQNKSASNPPKKHGNIPL